MGTCSYYRRFIKNFSEISRPLNQVNSKNFQFSWTPECQQVFDLLRKHLSTAPILAYLNYSLPFILDTDASAVGIGGVLSQVQDGQERVISYYSKMMSAEERNYCVTRQELLAIVKNITHSKPQLYGRPFIVRTDHASLTWLLRTPHPQGQLARWLETLASFDFRVEHRRGKVHSNVDGLSRQFCKDCRQCNQMTKPASQDTLFSPSICNLEQPISCQQIIQPLPTPKQVPISANLAQPSSKSHITPQVIPTPKSSEIMTLMDESRKNQVSRPIPSLLSLQTTWRGHMATTTSQKLVPQNKNSLLE